MIRSGRHTAEFGQNPSLPPCKFDCCDGVTLSGHGGGWRIGHATEGHTSISSRTRLNRLGRLSERYSFGLEHLQLWSHAHC